MRNLLLLLILPIAVQANDSLTADAGVMIKTMEEAKTEVRKLDNNEIVPCEEGKAPKAIIVEEEVEEKDKTELEKTRAVSPFMAKCLKDAKITAPKNFDEAIKIAIGLNEKPSGNHFSSYISGAYNVKNWKSNVGLYSHPMCESVDSFLAVRSSSTKKNKVSAVNSSLVALPKHFNKLRNSYLKLLKENKDAKKIRQAKASLDNFYVSLMGSLANHESLSTADNKTSRGHASGFASKFNAKGWKKPPGVKLYKDGAQKKADSVMNVGLYQLPMKGNIDPCITAWNSSIGKTTPSCKITNGKQDNMFLMLTASDQVFNAFCGTSKIVQSYGVQVNSDKFKPSSGSQRTHKENYVKRMSPIASKHKKSSSYKLKQPKDRCVSLFTHTSNTYNHFGTLGFTFKDNTKEVVNSVKSLEGIK